MRTSALAFSASLLAVTFLVSAGPCFAQGDVKPVTDNTALNQRDRGQRTLTPIDQPNNPADLNITREIRRSVVSDQQLSTNARNIKIITIDGAVTLRGTVNSEQEKADIQAKAARLAGIDRVNDQLEIAGQ